MSTVENAQVGGSPVVDRLEFWSSVYVKKAATGRGSNGKVSSYGIQKLRDLILELAVRGKLVPQDPAEEPASVLLKKIVEEKAKLIDRKAIKKPKKYPAIAEDEKPFQVPTNWAWVRLQEVTSYIQRGKGPSYAEQGRVRVVSQKCVQWSGFDLSESRHVDDDSLEKYQEERFLLENDLLWNSTGTGTVGRVSVLPNIAPGTLVADSHVTVIRPLLANSNYLWCYIAAPGIQMRVDPSHENALVSGTTKQVELNTNAVVPLEIPLPPLAEQHRIVAKVDDLMALCDQLEQQQTDSLQAHQTLVETLLRTLVDAGDAESTKEAWARIAAHFDTLFTAEESIDQLKQSILQIAVMGRLVPQDPSEEPASVLLEKFATEKEMLIKEGKLRKQKPLPLIAENDLPFVLPENWEVERLGTVSHLITKGTTPTTLGYTYAESGIAFVKVENIERGRIRVESISQYIGEDANRALERSQLEAGDVLFSIAGTIGKTCIVYEQDLPANTNQALAIIRGTSAVFDTRYLLMQLDSHVAEATRSKARGGAMLNVSLGDLSILVLPIPPLDEQHRIVAKVDKLMALCDTLKARIKEAQSTQVHLADAVVEQAVA